MKLKSKLYFIVFLLLLLNSCEPKKGLSKIYVTDGCADKFQTVNFKSIIDSPSLYDGHFVEICGYYESGFEESAIYSSETESNSEFAIWTDLPPSLVKMVVRDSEKLNGKKIKARGILQAGKGGHLINMRQL